MRFEQFHWQIVKNANYEPVLRAARIYEQFRTHLREDLRPRHARIKTRIKWRINILLPYTHA